MNSTRDGQVNFDDQLLSLIKEGENGRVEEILRNSNFYHSTDASGTTLLHYCALYGNRTVVQLLLDNGCNINTQDAMGNTSLMVATNESKIAVVDILLTNGADISIVNRERKNVLQMLCTNHKIRTGICKLLLCEFRKRCCNSEEAAQKLIEAGYDLYLAAYSLDYKIIKYMIERGCFVDSVHPLHKMTALHVVVFYADSDSVKVLLENGANPKALDRVHLRPLFYLYQDGKENDMKKIEILKKFLNLKISPTFCGLESTFDLGYTLIRGNREVIRVILKANPDFAIRDKLLGRTFMHYLAQNTNPDVVKELKYLKNMRYHVNIPDNFGYSPLSFAAMDGNVDMVKYLLTKGAEPNTADPPLYYAYTRSTPTLKNRYDQCVNLFFQHDLHLESMFIGEGGVKCTLFDVACETNDADKIKPVIAQLSLKEKSGLPITKRTRAKIYANPTLKKYFHEYKHLIGEKVFGSLTYSTLLSCHRKKMERYLNNKRLYKKIIHFNKKHKMKSSHPHLFYRWQKQYLAGKEYKKLRDGAVGPLCKIFRDCLDENHLVINKIINYLDIQSLVRLAQL